jgi:TolB-like protein/Tfp pilus assembly protein PilF
VSLIAELRRRNVFRVGAAYLALGWVVTQVTGTVAPALHLPPWTLPMVVWIGVIAFPFVMVFTWVYELTPEGLKRERDIDRSASITHVTARRLDYMVIGLLVLAIAVFAFDRIFPTRRQPDAQSAVAIAATPRGSGAATSATPAPVKAPAEKSIAVLPFVNMSGDSGNEYFSDGVSEEILNVLARTPELQVAARTSSFAFKGKTQDIPQIAAELRVRMVLEGSVRKQGDRVRITAQLIDAQTGFHLWSQTYDRKLADIFAIQDEIARAIGDELKVRMAGVGEPGTSNRGTADLAAYDFYLRALALWQERREKPLFDAIALLQRAIAADPKFAEAHAGLALVYAVLPDYSARIGYSESYVAATDAAEMAMALDPSLPEPFAVIASVEAQTRRSWATTRALFDRAIALRPSFATAHQWLGTALMSSGDLEGGVAESARAAELDPRSRVVGQNYAVVLTALGRYAEARAECDRVLRFAPDYVACEVTNGFVALLQGDRPAARRLLLHAAKVDSPGAAPMIEALVDAMDGRGDRRALARRLAAYPSRSWIDPASGTIFGSYETPALLVMLGERALALDYLERNAAEAGNTVEWPLMMAALDPIRCDPRFTALVKARKISDPHAARVCKAKG